MPWNPKAPGDGGGSEFSSTTYGDNSRSSQSQLGDFDSWKGAHERTFVDDVADTLSEMCRAAKVVTNDLLGIPRVPPPSL